MSFYLLDHRNPHGDHFYSSRRSRILAIVVHITAGLEDLDATDDHSAERTARYAATTDRSVSWHSGSDTDTAFDLLPDSYTAFHCRGYNSSTLGHEISKRHADWRTISRTFRDRSLLHAARHLGPKAQRHGIPFRVASKAELDRAIANGGPPVGFIGHHTLDPTRRSDPGLVQGTDTFPWHEFLELARHATAPTEDQYDMHGTEIITAYGEAGYLNATLHPDTLAQHWRDIRVWTHVIYAKPEPERDGGVAYIRALLGLA